MRIDTTAFELDGAEDEQALQSLVGPKGKWRETRDTQLRILEHVGLRPSDRLLDAGCGSLRVGLPLIGFLDKGNYHGIDVDPDCITASQDIAKRFSLDETKTPTIVQSTSFGVDELSDRAPFDVIWSYQVFIHLSPDFTPVALAAVSQMLKEDGAAYISVRTRGATAGLSNVGQWRDYPVTAGRAKDYADLAEAAGLDMNIVGTLGDFGLPSDRAGSANLLLKLVRKGAEHV